MLREVGKKARNMLNKEDASSSARTNQKDSRRKVNEKQPGNPQPPHVITLSEIQIHACRIHQRHGAYYGGYTLEDWLEAEHELNGDIPADSEKEDSVH